MRNIRVKYITLLCMLLAGLPMRQWRIRTIGRVGLSRDNDLYIMDE